MKMFLNIISCANIGWGCLIYFLLLPNAMMALRLYKEMGSGDYSSAEYSTPSINHKLKLQSDIMEFVELIPGEEVKAKITEYYKNDEDVQHIFNYVSGKDFWSMKKLMFEVRQVKEFEQYFINIGVNFKEILNKLDDLLGLSKLKPQSQLNRGGGPSK